MRFTIQRFFTITRLAFYSKEFYRMVYGRWQHLALLYLFWLSMLSYLPFGVWAWVQVHRVQIPSHAEWQTLLEHPPIAYRFGQLIRYGAEQFPSIHIAEGVGHTDATEPTVIYFPNSHRPMIRVDMREVAPPKNTSHETAPLIAFEKTLLAFTIAGERITYPYNELLPAQPIDINTSFLLDSAHRIRNWVLWLIPCMIMPLLAGIYWSILVLRAWLFSQLYRLGMSRTFSRKGLFRLAVITSAPAICLDLLCIALDIVITPALWPLIYVILPFGYFVYAARACKER